MAGYAPTSKTQLIMSTDKKLKYMCHDLMRSGHSWPATLEDFTPKELEDLDLTAQALEEIEGLNVGKTVRYSIVKITRTE